MNSITYEELLSYKEEFKFLPESLMPDDYMNNYKWITTECDISVEKNDVNKQKDSVIKSTLNKICSSTYESHLNKLMEVEIENEIQMKMLVDNIIQKILQEPVFSHIYMKLINYYINKFINIDNEKIYFRDFFFNEMERIFNLFLEVQDEENMGYFNYKKQIEGLFTFIGELYNMDYISKEILDDIIQKVYHKIETNIWYGPESLYLLVKKIRDTHDINYILEDIQGLLDRNTFKPKNKFKLMDIIDNY